MTGTAIHRVYAIGLLLSGCAITRPKPASDDHGRGRAQWVEKEDEEPPKKKRKEGSDPVLTRAGTMSSEQTVVVVYRHARLFDHQEEHPP